MQMMLFIALISSLIVNTPKVDSACPISTVVHDDGCCSVLIPPANDVETFRGTADECSDAVVAVEGANPFDTSLATPSEPQPDQSQCEGTYLDWDSSPDVWMVYTPSRNGLASFSTCDAASYDTSMVIYEGSCDNQIACNGDGSGDTGCQSYYSNILYVPVTAGTPYYIRLGGWLAATGAGTLTISSDAECADNDVIDVLWVYTPDALAYIGSPEEVLLQCQIAVDDANITFANTNLPFSVRIVGLHGTDYEETPDYLSHLQNPNDGYMDEVHSIRDAKAADIVALITVSGSCGLAYVAPGSPAYGFQECSAGCLVEEWAHPFRHELGHNLGSQHYVTDTYGYFSWSSGHRLTPKGGEEIGTSMGGNNIPHFSNPNVYYGGVPTGVPIGPDEEADNYSAFMVTVPMVADFRCSEDVCSGDINLDGNVNVADLLDLLADWGSCISCDADVLFDGTVDVNDLLLVIGAWGSCQ